MKALVQQGNRRREGIWASAVPSSMYPGQLCIYGGDRRASDESPPATTGSMPRTCVARAIASWRGNRRRRRALAREAGIRAEIFHLKAAGESNWPKMAQAIRRIEAARRSGVKLTCGHAIRTPRVRRDSTRQCRRRVQEGGLDAWVERLSNPDVRRRSREECARAQPSWENLYARCWLGGSCSAESGSRIRRSNL